MKKAIFLIGFLIVSSGSVWSQSSPGGGNPGNGNGNGNSAQATSLPTPLVNDIIRAVPEWFKVHCDVNATECCPGGNHGQLMQAYRNGCLGIEPLGGDFYRVSYAGGNAIVVVEGHL